MGKTLLNYGDRRVVKSITAIAASALLMASCAPDSLRQSRGPKSSHEEMLEAIAESQAALVASGGRGAQVLPNTAYLNYVEGKPCSVYVATTGNDSYPGTQSQPWRTVTKAIKTLKAGQIACVQPGSYNEVGAQTAASGTSTAPIVVRAADPANRPVLIKTSSGWGPLITFNHSYWVVDGLRFNANKQVTTVVYMSANSSFNTLRNSEVYGSAGGAGVSIYGKDAFVYKVVSHDNFKFDGDDSHAFHTFYPAARILIKDSTAYNNSGDGFQCEYYNGTIPNVPMDITFDGGQIYTDSAYFGRVEQAFDIKQCHRITVRNVTARGWRVKSNGAGGNCGLAFVTHVGANNVLIERNNFSDAEGAGNIHHEANSAFNVTFRNNIVRDIKNITGRCGYGLYVGRSQNVEVYNNTFEGIPKAAIYNAGPSSNVDIFNNIVKNSGEWIRINSGDTESDYNLFYDSNGSVNKLCTSGCVSLTSFQGSGRDRNSKYGDPMFLTDGSYKTASGSPARDSAYALPIAQCVAGQDMGCYCGVRGDRGAKESDCSGVSQPAPDTSTGGACPSVPDVLPIVAATASAVFDASNGPEKAIDSNYSSSWVCSGVGCYLQLDLGAVKSVSDVKVAWYNGTVRSNTFEIQTSENGSSYSRAFYGSSSGSSAALESYPFTARNARYARVVFYSNTAGNLFANIAEAQVVGKCASTTSTPTPTPTPTATATSTPTPTPTATSSPAPTGTLGVVSIASVTAASQSMADAPASYALDNNLSTYWACSGIDGSCFIRADLGSQKYVGALDLAWYMSTSRTEKFAIQLSADGVSYTQVYSGSSSLSYPEYQRFSFPARSARYVKIVGYGNSASAWNSLREMKVLAVGATSEPATTPTLPPSSGSYYLYPSQYYAQLPIDHYEQLAPDRLVSTTIENRKVLKFTVKPGDVLSWDSGNIGPGGLPNGRSEISYAPAADSAKWGAPNNFQYNAGVRTYTISLYFDKVWPANHKWATMLQFHPIKAAFGFGGISVHGGYLDVAKPFQDGAYIFRTPIVPYKWYDYQIVVNWSPTSSGFVKVYLGGQLVGTYNGPTSVQGDQYYMKQGYYRDGATAETGIVSQTIVGVSTQAP